MRLVEVFEDDMDGGKADLTVSFAFDGKAYEIDLSEANAAQFREVLQPYVEAARPVSNAKPSSRGRKANQSKATPAQIRQWARDSGYEVSERGRIPADVVAAYEGQFGA